MEPVKQRQDGLRKRWLRTVFLPAALITAAAVVFFAVYAYITLRAQALWAALFALCVGAALLISLWLLGRRWLRQVLEPVEQLRAQAERIAEGSYGIQTEPQRPDELGELTEKLNAVSRSIARASEAQTEFVSSVSHELRTPLTAITGWAEALSFDEAIRDDSRRGIEIISREASRLTKMVGELLEFTRIQDGRFRLNLEKVDIAAETEDTVFAFSKLLQQEQLHLSYSCDEETIPVIQGDGERLKQVIFNLLDNAAKYGKDGGSVEVSVVSDSHRVIITVRDHGPGIPEEELPHVKERFYKGSGRERGSGIGLAVCEEIISRHGGLLTIENAGDGGVLATVELPVEAV